MTGTERLHGGFLGREAGGERRRRVATAAAVFDFSVSEHAEDEPVAVSVDGTGYAVDLRGVEAGTYNFHLHESYMTLPSLPDSFEWREMSCGLVLRCRPFAAVAPHLFTTRLVSLSSADDWQGIAEAVGAARVVTPQQVHGRDVVVIRRGERSPAENPTCDALVSNDPRAAVAVRAADCVPLLIADARSGAVAAVHAGWRGVAAGAATAAVQTMIRELGSSPEWLHAAIGPSIGVCCYEVGSDVVDAFAAAGHARHLVDRWFVTPEARRGRLGPAGKGEGRLYLDVAGATRDQLVLAGVPEAQIHLSGLCTAMHLDVLTSYRAERQAAGRMAGVVRPPG